MCLHEGCAVRCDVITYNERKRELRYCMFPSLGQCLRLDVTSMRRVAALNCRGTAQYRGSRNCRLVQSFTLSSYETLVAAITAFKIFVKQDGWPGESGFGPEMYCGCIFENNDLRCLR